MNKNIVTIDQNLAEADEKPRIITDINEPRRTGLLIFFLVFIVFGGWATFAPIDGAALAPGTVTVESYKKAIQHLEGGIVKQILVRNGDRVQAGDPLLVLDDTQQQAQLEIANAQFVALKAREARLLAETSGAARISFPPELSPQIRNASDAMEAERLIFESRKTSLEGEAELLQQRIEQLHSRAAGLQAVQSSKEQLAASYADELSDIRALLSDGFADKNRLRSVERNEAVSSGEAAELSSTISSIELQILETRMQILQLNKDFLTEATAELGEVQTRLADIRERILALQDTVNRMVVRAPDDGVINGMQVHTEGGVIGPGAMIAELVPLNDKLVIEASVSPIDIDRVHEGQEAAISFSAFASGSVPRIYGKVTGLSADRMVDSNTGMAYYLARIEVSEEGMADLGDMVLVPGMPADAFIATGSRTFLQYLFKPFTTALDRSFIED